jgi:hypothetical protein
MQPRDSMYSIELSAEFPGLIPYDMLLSLRLVILNYPSSLIEYKNPAASSAYSPITLLVCFCIKSLYETILESEFE